jgi:predicted nuclease of predicted toxin-antitoxin system
MRVLTDENIPRELGILLQKSGHEVTSSAEAGLLGAKDESYLERATQTGELVLTEDKDFGLLQEFESSHRATRVLLLRYDRFDLESMSDDLLRALDEISSLRSDRRLMAVLSEGRLRLRMFE